MGEDNGVKLICFVFFFMLFSNKMIRLTFKAVSFSDGGL